MTLRRYAPLSPSAGTQIPLSIRHAVIERDRVCVCVAAGFPAEVQARCPGWPVELDHVRASHGIGMKSESVASNLVCLSAWCHRWKTEHGREARPILLAYLAAASEPEHAHVEPVTGCLRCLEAFE